MTALPSNHGVANSQSKAYSYRIPRHSEHYALPRNAKCKMQNAKLARHPEHYGALTVTIGKSAKDLSPVGSLN